MSWTLDQAKLELGIDPADSSQDAAITRTMAGVLDAVEQHLNRRLLLARELVNFYNVSHEQIWLPRYPIQAVHGINGEAPHAGCDIHRAYGWLQLNGLHGRDVAIDYEGGYAPDQLPAALELALWQAFHALWLAANPATGGPAAGSGGDSGEVQSITMQDYGTVRFNADSAMSGAESGGGVNWGWLAPWGSTLALYRALRA